MNWVAGISPTIASLILENNSEMLLVAVTSLLPPPPPPKTAATLAAKTAATLAAEAAATLATEATAAETTTATTKAATAAAKTTGTAEAATTEAARTAAKAATATKTTAAEAARTAAKAARATETTTTETTTAAAEAAGTTAKAAAALAAETAATLAAKAATARAATQRAYREAVSQYDFEEGLGTGVAQFVIPGIHVFKGFALKDDRLADEQKAGLDLIGQTKRAQERLERIAQGRILEIDVRDHPVALCTIEVDHRVEIELAGTLVECTKARTSAKPAKGPAVVVVVVISSAKPRSSGADTASLTTREGARGAEARGQHQRAHRRERPSQRWSHLVRGPPRACRSQR